MEFAVCGHAKTHLLFIYRNVILKTFYQLQKNKHL